MRETQGKQQGLYRSEFEHDACGIGFRAHLKGRKSHQIISDAIIMLERMDHRGACGADPNTGDGAGILFQIPHEFFVSECRKLGFRLPSAGTYGTGMLFLPKNKQLRQEVQDIISRTVKDLDMKLLGFRDVPTCKKSLGAGSRGVEPHVAQVFVERPRDLEEAMAFERKLYVLRQHVTKLILQTVKGIKGKFYFLGLSSKTISYKGQLTTNQLKEYYPDLLDEKVVSAFAIIHSRFSTNTFPSWELAQPFRFIAHNGEINTVKGNVNWARAAEASFATEAFTQEEMDMILPICRGGNSDSAMLDNMIELLYLSGRSLPHVMMMLIPEAWDVNKDMDPVRRAFYEYHASIMAPWDGPASISFTDGTLVGATLDRNGLRPSRYWVLDDDTVIMASEAGVLDVDPSKVVRKGRLQPGRMFVVDMEQGRIIPDEELKAEICSRQPYRQWIDSEKIQGNKLPQSIRPYHRYQPDQLLRRQISAGFTAEDLRMILAPMAEAAKPPIGSMGMDAPLAVLSHQSQHLSNYFKQLFAQVTNPPIDSIRERSIMSLNTFVGTADNILTETAQHCRQFGLSQPVLTVQEFNKLRFVDHKGFQTKTVNTYFNAGAQDPGKALEFAVDRICRYVVDAIHEGFETIILSDRATDSDHAAIPSLLAVSAVHHYLIREGLRGRASLVVEAADIWETHHYATLIGYGASAVCPYLALDTIAQMQEDQQLSADLSLTQLHQNYIKAVNKELLKIFSKMGISTLQSYQGAQIFECLGLKKSLIDKYFTGTISRIEGLGIPELAREVVMRHKVAYPTGPIFNMKRLEVGGIYQWKQRGDVHLFNPDTVHLLQQACRVGEKDLEKGYQIFKQYSKLINSATSKAMTLRSLLQFKESRSIPMEEVEPVEQIFKRFATGAMSFGSISWEAHTTLAIAMNRIGGRSNSGEGGEDEQRYVSDASGDDKNSRVKQVASGRFGVTSHYLSTADEIQIKMAQGAKPGEGGQLPGHKVDEWIGRVRHSTPGVGLISPPPHHDIYSIEDLAQLIYDLKNANEEARICVKLVSKAGVGTIASGVCKAHADAVLLSGFDGGTGASPLSSIRHAGLPWELGLAETHQTLVKNRLRSRIRVQVDGQLRTGRDLAIAALLGAEEFGVATAALVAAGCILMRKCHLNTCPVGIATQRKELRALFSGKPEHVINMFRFMAMELREYMAQLGFRSVDEMVGQVQKLQQKKKHKHWKYTNVDLSPILYRDPLSDEVGLYKQAEQDHGIDQVLDRQILADASAAIETGEKVSLAYQVNNLNRAIGTLTSYYISKKHGGAGLPDASIHIKLTGTAGQSLGAFATKGLCIELEGDSNDYFGKGLCGAELRVYPDRTASFPAENNIIIGNVAFYGATSGKAFIRGQAGERFCVRNSGAEVVVEGIGDHGCEYMTGGTAVILGKTGINFAAGMSGGLAFVLDVDGHFEDRCNMEMVDLDPLNDGDKERLLAMVTEHFQKTKSKRAGALLQDWDATLSKFVKVFPKDLKKIISKQLAEVQAKVA